MRSKLRVHICDTASKQDILRFALTRISQSIYVIWDMVCCLAFTMQRAQTASAAQAERRGALQSFLNDPHKLSLNPF